MILKPAFTVLTVISFHFVTSFAEATAGMASASAVPTAANRPSRMSLILVVQSPLGRLSGHTFPPPGQESNFPNGHAGTRSERERFANRLTRESSPAPPAKEVRR